MHWVGVAGDWDEAGGGRQVVGERGTAAQGAGEEEEEMLCATTRICFFSFSFSSPLILSAWSALSPTIAEVESKSELAIDVSRLAREYRCGITLPSLVYWS